MKNRVIWYCVTVFSILCFIDKSSFASSQSKHIYTCIGKYYGDDEGIIWLRDSTTGEYGEYDQLGIVVPRKSGTIFVNTVISSVLTDQLKATSAWEPMEELHDSGGIFYSDSGLIVTPPAYNAVFDSISMKLARDSILDHAGEIIAIGARYPHDLPTVNARTVSLIWAHPSGLYKNYKFKHVYWFSQSHILVVCTDQPRMGVGEDTMHGVLVLKAELNETTKQ